MAYPNLDFGREELAAAMREAYSELINFVTTDEFRAVYRDLMSLPQSRRPDFVSAVLLSKAQLERRGVVVPDEILIQVSAFGDRRPTLFAVKKFLPEKFHAAWENVNLTFDNEFDDSDVPRNVEAAWRAPLPVTLQNETIATGGDLQAIPEEKGVDAEFFAPLIPVGFK